MKTLAALFSCLAALSQRTRAAGKASVEFRYLNVVGEIKCKDIYSQEQYEKEAAMKRSIYTYYKEVGTLRS